MAPTALKRAYTALLRHAGTLLMAPSAAALAVGV